MRAPEKEKHLEVFYCACCESYNTRHILLKHFSRYALPDVYLRITHYAFNNYSDELAIIISYPTSASGIIVLSKTPTKYTRVSALGKERRSTLGEKLNKLVEKS